MCIRDSSYIEVVKTAILPAAISYIALVYIVHLEAVKADLKGLDRPPPLHPLKTRLLRGGLIISALLILVSGSIGSSKRYKCCWAISPPGLFWPC